MWETWEWAWWRSGIWFSTLWQEEAFWQKGLWKLALFCTRLHDWRPSRLSFPMWLLLPVLDWQFHLRLELADVSGQSFSLQLDSQVACRGLVFLNRWWNCVHVVLYMETSIQKGNEQNLLLLHYLKLRVDQNVIWKLVHFTVISVVLLFCFWIAWKQEEIPVMVSSDHKGGRMRMSNLDVGGLLLTVVWIDINSTS